MKRKLKTLSRFMKKCKSLTRKQCHMGDNSNHSQLHLSVRAGRGTLESNKIDWGFMSAGFPAQAVRKNRNTEAIFLPSLAEISPTNAQNNAQQRRVYVALQASMTMRPFDMGSLTQ